VLRDPSDVDRAAPPENTLGVAPTSEACATSIDNIEPDTKPSDRSLGSSQQIGSVVSARRNIKD